MQIGAAAARQIETHTDAPDRRVVGIRIRYACWCEVIHVRHGAACRRHEDGQLRWLRHAVGWHTRVIPTSRIFKPGSSP